MASQIKVLSKVDRLKQTSSAHTDISDGNPESSQITSQFDSKLKHESEAQTFKLIDDKEWNIALREPSSETTFFADGHSAMSIISVMGSRGVGKSTLLNKIAQKDAFKTHHGHSATHITRGVDIHSTHHRILLDCQPLLSTSVLEDFLSGHSSSQFAKHTQISDPLTSCHMISLQLATFLIAVSDFVLIKTNWLVDVHLLKLISTAIMMIGDELRAEFIIYSENEKVVSDKLKLIINSCLGDNATYKFITNESELLDYTGPYSSGKCDTYVKAPLTFTGKTWLSNCQRLWNTKIKNSSMFSDYAMQIHSANNVM